MSKSVVAIVSDLHTNSTLGLCPPRGIPLDDGGTYLPSGGQLWLWDRWEEYWDRVAEVANRTARGKDRKPSLGHVPLVVVLNGDLTDGDHHGTAQIATRNMTTQLEAVMNCLFTMRNLQPDRIYVVRGTEAHVGKSGEYEEAIAQRIGAERDPSTGTASRWHLRLNVEDVRFDIAHHGRMGTKRTTRANSISDQAVQEIVAAREDGRVPAHLLIRSHRHLYADSYKNYSVRAIQTPAWQMATSYVHRIDAGALAHVGGLIVECESGEYDVDVTVSKPSPEPFEEVST